MQPYIETGQETNVGDLMTAEKDQSNAMLVVQQV